MARAILANCSSMDIVFIVITSIVTANEKIEELEWLKKLSFFDIPIGDSKCDSVLELASAAQGIGRVIL